MNNSKAMPPQPHDQYNEERIVSWDLVAKRLGSLGTVRNYYHSRLQEIYRLNIPKGSTVLELGCGCGDLLASVNPSVGVGVDFSGEMLEIARSRYPDLSFHQQDVQQLVLDEKFDFIILSDLVNDVEDVQTVFDVVKAHCDLNTRIVLNFYSHLWGAPLSLAQKIGWATPTLLQNWLTVSDIGDLMDLAGLEPIRSTKEVLWPIKTPFVDSLFNRYLVRLWPFKYFSLTNFMIARVQPENTQVDEGLSVTIVCAARNEEGHIEEIIKRTPELGRHTELIFVEGNSTDNTYSKIEKEIANNPHRDLSLYKQPGKGKGDAVRCGFQHATGDILMILDADMTVPPEDLTRFYNAIASGKGEYINGVRLVYPMEEQAMRFLNILGNKFFSLAFSWLLGQPIKDCLCGTKVLTRENYLRISENRSYFGDFDPFGDFDLIFGSAKINLKFIDLPIRYKERRYGDTNIDRWGHGWLLLKMVFFAARRIKFV
ncbi:MAG: glycosyltransferase [Gammaproteobacteria bacterium]|nr:glycosyltransferase [Gammaproteobacteria bacterium]